MKYSYASGELARHFDDKWRGRPAAIRKIDREENVFVFKHAGAPVA
jgi:hypothetical protein